VGRLASGLLVLVLSLSLAAVAAGQDKPPTPREKFKARRQKYDVATGSGVPLGDEERLKFVGRVYRQHIDVAM
jgi:hypothetical protein